MYLFNEFLINCRLLKPKFKPVIDQILEKIAASSSRGGRGLQILLQKVETYLKQCPVLGFNSSRYVYIII